MERDNRCSGSACLKFLFEGEEEAMPEVVLFVVVVVDCNGNGGSMGSSSAKNNS